MNEGIGKIIDSMPKPKRPARLEVAPCGRGQGRGHEGVGAGVGGGAMSGKRDSGGDTMAGLAIVAAACASVGVGCIAGAGAGWLTMGALTACILLALAVSGG